MIPILSFFFLFFTNIQVNAEDCPNSYFPISSENVCIHVSNRGLKKGDMENYCSGEASGGKPFFRRFSDDSLEELQKHMWNTFRNSFSPKVYVGIKRDSSFGSTKWNFANDEGSIEEKDFTLWAEDPSNFDCGIVAYSNGLGVTPQFCSQGTNYICQKREEPCESTPTRFVKYFGRCLTIVARDDSYQAAESICDQLGAYLIPYKDKSQTNSIGAVVYNFNALDGGIFTGMQKDSETGKWQYPDGTEETSRWDPTDSREFDCALTGFLADRSLGLFTMSCDADFRIFCAIGG